MAAMIGERRPALKNEAPGNGSNAAGAASVVTNAGQLPGSWCEFSGTWACAYQPPSSSHVRSDRCGVKSVGRPMGQTLGTPQECTQVSSSDQPLHGVSTRRAYVLS